MISIYENKNIKIILLLIIGLLILLTIKVILNLFIEKKELEISKKSIIGYEEIQEDYSKIVCKENKTLAVLADGLGKNKAGRISSIVSVKTIAKMFEEENGTSKIKYFFKSAYNKANKEILKRIEEYKGGASVLSVVIDNGLLNYALVGEVMLCIYRKKELVKLTQGHSMSEVAKTAYLKGKIEKRDALIALKEDKLLYYMGQQSLKNIEINDIPIKLKKNDLIILMTKGIYESIKWVDIEEILSQRNVKVNDLAEDIIESIESNNNRSNGTIILMKYSKKR